MMEWYMALDGLMKVFWGCAIASSIVFGVQTALSFIGADSDINFEGGDGFDGDTLGTGGALNLFTLRGFVNLLLGFGWTGVCCRRLIESDLWLVLLALAMGVIFVLVCAYIMRKMMRLEHCGNVLARDVIGRTGTVYLRIPADGVGKVQLSVNGSVREFDAVASKPLPTGTTVIVIEAMTNGLFRVAPKDMKYPEE